MNELDDILPQGSGNNKKERLSNEKGTNTTNLQKVRFDFPGFSTRFPNFFSTFELNTDPDRSPATSEPPLRP